MNGFAGAFLAALLALVLTILQVTGARAQEQGILMPGTPSSPVSPASRHLTRRSRRAPTRSTRSTSISTDPRHRSSTGCNRRACAGADHPAQTPFKVRARDVGQVSAIALDDARTPNIYVGQTSAFSLQIVGPDADGDGRPDRLRKGQSDAQWMAGQFGTDKGGGPGSIYRIDGRTGAVSLFATIPGNSGTGLGAIVFDKASRHVFRVGPRHRSDPPPRRQRLR